MNRKEFEEKLNEFGWHITPSHNGLNHRIESNDCTKTILLHYHEAKSLKDVFGGKLFIDYTINEEVTNE